MSSPEDDARLMRRIAAGDRGAAQQLMDRSLPGILATARRILRDPIEAEDVAQDTFLRAWKAAGRWQMGQAKLETWMNRIAANLCIDRIRKKRAVAIETPPERADPGIAADTSMIVSEAVSVVSSAVSQLPERQRLALELCHFQQRSNIEAAEMLEISVEALESLLARARRKLKAELLPQQDDLVSSLVAGAGSGMETE